MSLKCLKCSIPMKKSSKDGPVTVDGVTVTVTIPADVCPVCGSVNFSTDDLSEAKATAERMVRG